MSSIDERVVEMKFKESGFATGIASALGSLDKLKKGLNLTGAANGLDDISKRASRFSLAGMGQTLDGIKAKFGAMSVVGIAALANLTNKAVDAGLRLAKSFTIQPITDGFAEYETKMSSIQTILSNTARYGTKLPEVTKNLDALNAYADKTIYSFSDMTKNIGLFTNAGIKVGDATSMIKGFSNEAAASGTSAQGAAGAAYQLSQALSAGKITLMDWKSLQNVGMGNSNMKKGITDIAIAMGQFSKGSKKANEVNKDFNGSLKDGWLSADVMSNYLKIMAGDMSAAEQKTLGLTDAQIKQFKVQQKNAEDSATKVRTFTQLVGTLQEAVGSGWGSLFEVVLGDFESATTLFSSVSDKLGGMIGKSFQAREKMLQDWSKAGGRQAIIDAIASAFNSLMNIMSAVGKAFRSVFPATTGAQLADISKAIANVAKKFEEWTKINAGPITATLKGVFSILGIGWEVLKGVAHLFGSLIGLFSGGTGGVLAFTGGLGEMISKLLIWIKQTNAIKNFFDILINAATVVIGPLVKAVGSLVSAFGKLFSGDTKGFFAGLKESVSFLQPAFDAITDAFQTLMDKLGTAGTFVKQFYDDITGQSSTALSQISTYAEDALSRVQTWLSNLGSTALAPITDLVGKLGSSFQGLKDKFNFNLQMNTDGLKEAGEKMSSFAALSERAKAAGSKLSGVWDGIKNAFRGLSDIFGKVGDALGPVFGALRERLIAYIKGLDLQDAVALLNTGFFIAFYITLKKFIKNVGDLMDGVGDIMDSITGVFDQLTSSLKTMQQQVKADMILKIAIALGVLTASVFVLSTIDVQSLGKALGALTIMFIQLTATLAVFAKLDFKGGMTRAALALVVLSVAVLLLASAAKMLADLSWEQLAKGLIGTGALLGALLLFSRFADAGNGGIKSRAGLLLLAIAIKTLAEAVQTIGSMDTGVLIKGVLALTTLLVLLGAMVQVINNTKGILQASAGLLLLSAALYAMQFSILAYAGIDWGTFTKGLLLMSVALVALAVSMNLMPKDLLALSAGILVISAALVILAFALGQMGGMSMEEIAKSLLVLIVSLTALTIAMIAMTGTAPGAAALIVMVAALALLTPVLMALGMMSWEAIVKGLVAITAVFVIFGLAGLLLGPVVPILMALGIAIGVIGAAALLAGLGFVAFGIGLGLIAASGTAAAAVLTAALMGFLNLIPLFMQQVAMGIRAFAKVIADSGPVLVNAFTTVFISILKAIQRTAPQFFSTVQTLVLGIIRTITNMLPQILSMGLKMILNLLKGIADNVGRIVTEATRIVTEFIKAVGAAGVRIIAAGVSMIINFLNGVAATIRSNSAAMNAAGYNVGSAIIEGMASGVRQGAGMIRDAAVNAAKAAWESVKSFLGINSPSRLFMEVGAYTSEGMAIGITKAAPLAAAASENVGHQVVNSLRKTISVIPDLLSDSMDLTPTITPVLDLTQVKAGTSKLDSMFGTPTVDVRRDFVRAKDASASYDSNRAAASLFAQGGNETSPVTFVQNNNSPKALSAAEIYRQTNNQLSVAKGAMKV